jgi:hypothetical protein
MSEKGIQPVAFGYLSINVNEVSHLSESVRLLWEGTDKALRQAGMDRSDVVSLCDIIVRLSDHRLLIIQAKHPSPESEQAADQVRHYRQLAWDRLQWASKPLPEPDWSEIDKRIQAAALADFPVNSKE